MGFAQSEHFVDEKIRTKFWILYLIDIDLMTEHHGTDYVLMSIFEVGWFEPILVHSQ